MPNSFESTPKRPSPGDPNSYSRPDQAKVTDIFLKLDNYFDTKLS